MLVALTTFVLPVALLEQLVLASGIAAFIPAAEPPLGVTARISVGVFAGGLAAMIAWFALSALLGWHEWRSAGADDGRPVVRRADAHPDAPPREPLRARDLELTPMKAKRSVATEEEAARTDNAAHAYDADDGADLAILELDTPPPPPEPVIAMGAPLPVSPPEGHGPSVTGEPAADPVVQPLPIDLNQPLAAFDPSAIPDSPRAPPPPVRPLRRASPPVYTASERFETFELTPTVRPASATAVPAAIAAPETDASVHALLDRLERGIARRAVGSAPGQGLESALDELRRMAARG